MSCGVGHRGSSDLALLWLWHRPAATALIRPLAWEPPYATGVALKKDKKTTPPQIKTNLYMNNVFNVVKDRVSLNLKIFVIKKGIRKNKKNNHEMISYVSIML